MKKIILSEKQIKFIVDNLINEGVSSLDEQTVVKKSLEPKKFLLPNNTFASGKYQEFNKSAVDGVIDQMNQYLKGYPLNQKIKVEIESSESKVPNSGAGFKPGQLSNFRAAEMKKYLQGKLPQNVELVIKDLGAQGPEWKASNGKDNPMYTKYQYVNFNIVGGGEKEEIECDLGFSIIVDYRKEWCKPGVDESRCHKCNEAVFLMWANGIPLTTKDGDVNINLNNEDGYSYGQKSGPSRVVELVVTAEQKQQILAKNPEEILLTYSCSLPLCHSDPAHITIVNSKGQVLLPGTFVTTGGQQLSNVRRVKLLKLNKCGQKIAIFGDEGMGEDVAPQKPKAEPVYRILNYRKSLYELYRLLNKEGKIVIPADKEKYFKNYKMINGMDWETALDTLGVENAARREFRRYLRDRNS